MVVVEVLVDPEEEVLVLVERIDCQIGGPEDPLTHRDRETTSEKIISSFFKWYSKQCLSWARVVSS
jgi:hypothetical protein